MTSHNCVYPCPLYHLAVHPSGYLNHTGCLGTSVHATCPATLIHIPLRVGACTHSGHTGTWTYTASRALVQKHTSPAGTCTKTHQPRGHLNTHRLRRHLRIPTYHGPVGTCAHIHWPCGHLHTHPLALRALAHYALPRGPCTHTTHAHIGPAGTCTTQTLAMWIIVHTMLNCTVFSMLVLEY